MDNGNIAIYGAMWCGDCRRAKKFFDSFNIDYRWIDVDADPHAATYVMAVNRGMRSIPTIVFQDGSIMVEPTNPELARKLNISLGS